MNVIATASILDPRFKKLYFNDNLACAKVINSITHKLNEKICEPEDIAQSNSDENVSSNVDKETASKADDAALDVEL